MVRLIARFPHVAAWIVCLALVGAVAVEILLTVQLTSPPAPPGAEHIHGVVVAVQPTGAFALRIPGQPGVLWFHPAAHASISLAHLQRHRLEQAGTDVTNVRDQHGALVAWSAD